MRVIKPANSKKETIYFDVDDTLIFEALPEEDGAFLLNDGEAWRWYKSHKKHVAELRKLYQEDHQIIIWTHHQLGADWAHQSALALGLESLAGGLEIICMAKPYSFYDDMPAEEIFHPSLRRYLAKD